MKYSLLPTKLQPLSLPAKWVQRIQNTAMICLFGSALLYMISFIAGFGHKLLRMERIH